jgi:excisionase family DNA binding protein
VKVERVAYRPAEAAEALGVSVATIYRLIGRGEIRAVKIGRAVRIHRDELERLADPSYHCEEVSGGVLS